MNEGGLWWADGNFGVDAMFAGGDAFDGEGWGFCGFSLNIYDKKDCLDFVLGAVCASS
jgi:hypothetical protein